MMQVPVRSTRLTAVAGAILLACFLIAPPVAFAKTIVETEIAPERVETTALATVSYRATDTEKTFLERTPANERTNGDINDETTAYDLTKRIGKRVAWFGIVREVHKIDDNTYELLLEHKFYDGLSDAHILALSFNSAGDFRARVESDAPPPEVLSLVRVYGKVNGPKPTNGKSADAKDPADKLPVVRAEYLRVFPWKTFTFIACYGKQTGNPKWRELCKVDPDHIYSPTPDDEYYEKRLGPRPSAK